MDGKSPSILHIASDEKFINAANYVFENAFPGSNHFVIPKSYFNRKLIYVKKESNIEIITNNGSLVRKLLKMVPLYDCVVLHGLNELNCTLFMQSSATGNFVGIFWGAELYTKENFPDREFLGHMTASISLPAIKVTPADKIKSLMRSLLDQDQVLMPGSINRAVSRLSYFAVPFEEEFRNFSERKIISESCRYIPFTYYPLEFIIKGNESLRVNGNDILVGNSANYTNNHLEAFKLIGETGLGNRKIVVPLSYGDAQYGDFIHAEGERIFGQSFVPLRHFMPLERYTRTLQKCGVVIMNHYRQQAVGNILAMIWMGARVYLNESSTIYHYLKRLGVKVFSVDSDLTGSNLQAFSNLEEGDAELNRDILRREFSKETVISRLRLALYEHLFNGQ
jgi:hypothetical protein